MKLFLQKATLFIALPVVVLLAVFFVISGNVNRRLDDIARNYNCLIMGDSQVQRINPDFFKSKTFNFGSSGEHYYFTYAKLKKLLSIKEGNIKIIVLGVSVHNFAPVYQRMDNLSCKEGKKSLERYLYFLNYFDDGEFNFKNIIFHKDFYGGLLKSPDWNGFKESLNKNPDKEDMDKILEIHYKKDTEMDSSKQQYYLEKIIRLCDKHNVKILAVSTPIHKYYKSNIPKIHFDNLIDVLKKNAELPHLNYLNVDISANFFSDANHLNKEGASIYSKLISNKVEQLVSTFNN